MLCNAFSLIVCYHGSPWRQQYSVMHIVQRAKYGMKGSGESFPDTWPLVVLDAIRYKVPLFKCEICSCYQGASFEENATNFIEALWSTCDWANRLLLLTEKVLIFSVHQTWKMAYDHHDKQGNWLRKSFNFWAAEVVQWIKCFPYKQEDLDSVLRTCRKTPRILVCACSPSPAEAETGRSLGFADGIPYSTWWVTGQCETLSKSKVEQQPRLTLGLQMHVHTHIEMLICRRREREFENGSAKV